MEFIIETLGYSIAWYALSELIFYVVPQPKSIADPNNPKLKKRHTFFTSWVSMIHAIFMSSSCNTTPKKALSASL